MAVEEIDVDKLDPENPEDAAQLDKLLDQLTNEDEPVDEPAQPEPAAASEPSEPKPPEPVVDEPKADADSTTVTPDAATTPAEDKDWKKEAELGQQRYETLKGRIAKREEEIETLKRNAAERDAEYQKASRLVNDPRVAKILLELDGGSPQEPSQQNFDYTNPADIERIIDQRVQRMREEDRRNNAIATERNRSITFNSRVNADKEFAAVEHGVPVEEVDAAMQEFTTQFNDGKIATIAMNLRKLKTLTDIIAEAERRGAEAERQKFMKASKEPKRLANVQGGISPDLAQKSFKEMSDAELNQASLRPDLTSKQEDEILEELLRRG